MTNNQAVERIRTAVCFWALIVLSACLLGGAFALSFRLWRAEMLDYIRLVQATFLAYGLGIGLFGSAIALFAPTSQRRFGTATTIHGFGFVVLSFVGRRCLEQRMSGYGLPIAPLLIPAAIIGLSLVMFIAGWLARPVQTPPTDDTKAEPPQPRSQP